MIYFYDNHVKNYMIFHEKQSRFKIETVRVILRLFNLKSPF
jgi:hypothetical protein